MSNIIILELFSCVLIHIALILLWGEIFFILVIAMALLGGRNIICLGKMVTNIDCCDA